MGLGRCPEGRRKQSGSQHETSLIRVGGKGKREEGGMTKVR